MSFVASFYYIAALPYLAFHYRGAFRGFPDDAWNPIFLFRVLGLPPVSETLALPAYSLLALLLLAAASGFGGRPLRALTCLAAVWVFGSRYNFGVELAQVDAPLVLGFLVLAIGREPTAALRAIPAFVIFSAGAFKLWSSGLAWLTEDALRLHLMIRHGTGADGLAGFLLAHPALTRAASALTLPFELSFPLALLGGFIEVIYICALGAFLLAVFLALGHPFLFSLLPFLGAFIPATAAAGFLRRTLSSWRK